MRLPTKAHPSRRGARRLGWALALPPILLGHMLGSRSQRHSY